MSNLYGHIWFWLIVVTSLLATALVIVWLESAHKGPTDDEDGDL